MYPFKTALNSFLNKARFKYLKMESHKTFRHPMLKTLPHSALSTQVKLDNPDL